MKVSSKRKSQNMREISALQRRVHELELERSRGTRAERALWQYWNLLDALLNSSPDLFAVKSPACAYQAASMNFCRFAGRLEHEIVGRRDFDLFPRDIAEVFQRHDLAVLRQVQPKTWEEEMPGNKGPQWFRFYKSPVMGASGACVGLLCTVRDITHEKRAEEQNQILNRIGQDGFWLLDAHGTILDVNQTYCEMSGYSRTELVGKSIHDIEALAAPEDMALQNPRMLEVGWDRFRTLHRTKSNHILEFDVCTNYSDVAGGRFYRFFREITPVKTEEEPVSLNPPPAAALSTAQMDRRIINLNDVVQQALTLQMAQLPANVRIVQDLDATLWNTVAQQPQILQILMNLVTNAVEALDGSGRILIHTRNMEMTWDLVQAYPQLNTGRYVFLSVEDTGRGINAKLLDKIFDPFITTKFRGRGMGLASVTRNVRENNGHITVKSKEGHGTTFTVYLPATDAKIDLPSSHMHLPIGTETILIIDNERYVLQETRRILEQLAYKVLAAANVNEAVQVIRTFPGRVHAAVLDIHSLTSAENPVAMLRRACPNIKVILSSMTELDRLAQDLLDAGASTFIQKPFRVEVLGPKIRHVLDE